MDDRRIDKLIRLAGEVDEFERAAMQAPGVMPRVQVRRGAAGGWGGVAGRIGVFAAAAACVAAAVVMSRSPVPQPAPVRVVEREAPKERTPLREAGGTAVAVSQVVEAPDPSVLLGIFEDASGAVRCVQWKQQDWGGRSPEDLAPGELVKETYGTHCVVGPHLLIAVNVSGPSATLPQDEEEAQALASCIIGESTSPVFRKCGVDPSQFNSSAVHCLPSGLKVRVETLAMGK